MSAIPIDPRADRRNGLYFFWAVLLTYLAAPVLYVGVAQAALCDKLGASATVANLPNSLFFVASFAPIVVACFVPHRWDRQVVVYSSIFYAALMLAMVFALVLPFGNGVRIAAVVIQSLTLGLANSVQQIYIYQCLGRGTTEEGRSRALKLTFTFGPLAAVAGSLFAQFVLNGGISYLRFPRDFASLYLLAAPCMAIVAWCCNRMELPPIPDDVPAPFFSALWGNLRRYAASRSLVLLLLAYIGWYCTLQALPNLLLYIRHSIRREPADFSGVSLALRFGCKALAGYGLGVLNLRYGGRAPLLATVAALGAAVIWAWLVPGYAYLFAFGLMGAGELGGAYFPNSVLTLSSPAHAVGDMAILNLATPLSGLFGTLHGLLADHWGFHASFAFGIAAAAAAFLVVLMLPKGTARTVN